MSEDLELAGRGRRLAATLLDAALVPSLTLFLVMITGVVEDAEDFTDNWWMMRVLLLAIASYLLLNGLGLLRHGQTLGKRMLGIAMVAANGSGSDPCRPAPFWKLVFVRAPFFPLLFMIIVPSLAALPLIDQAFIFGKRRRCLHDLLAGTVVVRLRRESRAESQPKAETTT